MKRTNERPWRVFYKKQRVSHEKIMNQQVVAASGTKAFLKAIELYKIEFGESPDDLRCFYVSEARYPWCYCEYGWDAVGDLPRKRKWPKKVVINEE